MASSRPQARFAEDHRLRIELFKSTEFGEELICPSPAGCVLWLQMDQEGQQCC